MTASLCGNVRGTDRGQQMLSASVRSHSAIALFSRDGGWLMSRANAVGMGGLWIVILPLEVNALLCGNISGSSAGQQKLCAGAFTLMRYCALPL